MALLSKHSLRGYLRFVLIALGILFATTFFLHKSSSEQKGTQINLKKENSQVSDITTAANNLLKTFNGEQLERIKFDFSDDERFNWHYVPRGREGILIKEFNNIQQKLFSSLLNTSLSQKGVEKTEGVLTLESVLYDLSGQSSFRDPAEYYVSFFGTPYISIPWGWRFEGHHLSLNFTIMPAGQNGGSDTVIVSTPMFFGANPAEVREGKHKGLRVLKLEEDYARELVKSLNKEQLKEALFDEDAPNEIITGNDERVDPLNPKGISVSKLNQNQSEVLLKLIREYIENSKPKLAEQRTIDLKNSKDIYFAWAGGFEKGQPHYYRIQSNTFLIEYDNTQNNANHIHSVWRSFKNDFGVDLLRKHYEEVRH
jgi:outer membrane lipoprotein-sorting protein